MSTLPRFYFSFRSPYSWIAARQLAEHLGERYGVLELIPFWEPDERMLASLKTMGGQFLYTQMSRDKHLYILQDIKRITTRLRYKMAWPIDRQPWWDLSHLAYLAAREQGKGMEFFWGIYRARWERGEDISAADTIRTVAKEAGLDPEKMVNAVEDDEIRKAGAQALYRAYREGVFGVPFFILGYEKFWGIDRLDLFTAALNSNLDSTLTRGNNDEGKNRPGQNTPGQST